VVGYTAASVVTSVNEKRRLAQRTGAAVVDMEGVALAAALAARGLRPAMVRVVSDDAEHDLPPLEGAIDASGTLRPERVALAFARRPLAAVRFARDAQRALAALERVARALIALPA
jgi:uridine phosphorylase